MDGAAVSSGLAIQQIAREKKQHLSDHRTGVVRLHRQAVLAVRHPFRLRYVCAGARHRPRLDQGGREYVVLHHRRLCVRLCAGARHHRSRAGRRRQGAGHVRAPLATPDFSNYLMQAKASGAKVFGFANAGTDLQNCIKQAAEFGMTKAAPSIATLLMAINDVHSLGLQGLPRVGLHGFVLLGHERPDARVREALGREDGRHGAWPAACGELLRREPLAEVGEGRRHHRTPSKWWRR